MHITLREQAPEGIFFFNLPINFIIFAKMMKLALTNDKISDIL